ncbi:MAG TPA: lysylphosphatidylglycerol synthase transmembrane domain-containing protein [Longimicrobiaceae bacterium]|nr:lysylphosphatidylglycerol synthase transmembrane domain-containing protein [Longimicrobiaceae bacterium]
MKQRLRALVGIAATVFFLWFALRDVVWSDVWAHLREANWLLLLAAVVVSTLGMHIRALRWKALLAPVAPDVPLQPRLAGTFVGFAVNNLLPARIGEFARSLVCARLGRIPVSAVFASLIVERVLDGLVMVGFLFAAMSSPNFPVTHDVAGVDPRAAARFLAGFALLVGGVTVAMAFLPRHAVRLAGRVARHLPLRVGRPLMGALAAFLGGLGVLRKPRLLAISVAWALFQWTFLAMSFVLAFRAFGITEAGFAGAVFLQSLIAMAVSIPSGPGFFGVYEAAAVGGLALWGVDESRAASFAIGFHLGGWLSVTGIGLWYIWRLGLSWRELRRSDEEVEEAVERDPALHPPSGAEPRDG